MKAHLKHLTASIGLLAMALSALGTTRSPSTGELLIQLETAGRGTSRDSGDFADGVAVTLPSIVTIRTSASGQTVAHSQAPFGPGRSGPLRGEDNSSTGSGVIVSAGGHIVTNHHVVLGARTIHVEFHDGRRLVAHLLGSDPASDIALLKVDADGLIPAIFANSDDLRLGEAVAAIGNPFDVGISITTGVVSALGRHGTTITADDYFIQTDAALNPGNSGGALVSRRGQVVGINTAIHSRTGSNTGVGFAVPSVTVQAVCQQILDHGDVRRGQLGVVLESVSSSQRGVGIESVTTDGPAARAGIRTGDRIIAVNSRPIHQGAALRNSVRLARAGDVLMVRILRGDEEITLDATLGEELPDAPPSGKDNPQHGKANPRAVPEMRPTPTDLHSRIQPG
jgi:S1-C subfamily serine protease